MAKQTGLQLLLCQVCGCSLKRQKLSVVLFMGFELFFLVEVLFTALVVALKNKGKWSKS